MRFSGRLLTLAMILTTTAACSKKAGSDAKGEPVQGPSDGGPGPETNANTDSETKTDTNTEKTVTPGTVAVVEFGVFPVNSSEGGSTALAAHNLQAALKAGDLGLAVPSASLRRKSFSLDPVPVPHPEQISSGAPDSMKVFVSKILLKKAEGGASATLFDHPEGAPIDFKPDGSVDLTALSEAAKTGETSLRLAETGEDPSRVMLGVEATGDYDVLAVEFLAGAEVKGCVYAEWDDDMAGGTNVTVQPRIYCTRTGRSSFESTAAAGALHTDFVAADLDTDHKPDAGSEAEPTKMNIAKVWSGDLNLPTGKFTVEYKLPKPTTLAVDQTTSLAMVVDMNRMLRFYRDFNGGEPLHADTNTSGAFFFNSVWDESTYVTLGAPGRIYGFQVVAEACDKADFDADQDCDGTKFDIGGWLTMIMNADGKPVSALMMPDDDNALTVTKGIANDHDGKDFITAGSADGLVDLHYALGQDGACTPGGTVFDFPSGINDIQKDDQVDALFEGVKCSGGGSNEFKGPIHLIRGL